MVRSVLGLTVLSIALLSAFPAGADDSGELGQKKGLNPGKEPVQQGDAGTKPGPSPDDYPGKAESDAKPDAKPPKRKLTPQELKELALKGKVRKVVDKRFKRQRRADNRFARTSLDDFFVVARLDVLRVSGLAEVRFAAVQGLDKGVDATTDYLIATPRGRVRDFMVVGRYDSLTDAERGLAIARKKYDDAQTYQLRFLNYLQQAQQMRVQSMRRC